MSKSYIESAMAAGYDYDQIVPIDFETFRQILDRIADRPKPTKAPTAIPTLDGIIGGFAPGRLYILSAPTKAGKTTMAQTFMHNLGKQDIRSLIFSYEMGSEEIAEIFGDMDKADNVTTELPVYLPTELHRGGGSLQYQWLFEAMAKAKLEKGVSVVVIDHLHFLLPLKDFKNTSFILGGIVREIKRIAESLKIAIILIAHTAMIKDDKVPDWTMIRDSSFITQEADCVMMMYRIKNKAAARKQSDDSTADVYKNKTILSVELNRMGGKTGKVKLMHNGVKFVELSEMEDFANAVADVNSGVKFEDIPL